jgi:hypothetical protein
MLKGIMLTGNMLLNDIHGAICEKLEANSVEGWIHFLLLVMEKNIFVIVLAKEKTVAQALLDCNGGAQVLPLPGCFTGSSQSPEWKDTTWTVNELVNLVLDNHPSKYSNEEARQLVHAGMTPPDAVKVVNAGEYRGRDLLYSPRRK